MPLAECSACLCFAARRAARVITQRYDQALRGTGLRATQFTLLVVLSTRRDPPSLSFVADAMGMERTTLTRNLKTLVARGYVKDAPSDDLRTRKLQITARGRQAAVKALPKWRKAQTAMLKELPAGSAQLLWAVKGGRG